MEHYALDYKQYPTTTVNFGLKGDTLEPLTITSSLGVSPSQAWAKGEPIPGSNPSRPQIRRIGAWILASPSSKHDSFNEQLIRLLDELEVMPPALRHLIDEFEGGVAVGYSSGEQHIGFVVNQNEIRRLSLLGLAISFSIYPGLTDGEAVVTKDV